MFGAELPEVIMARLLFWGLLPIVLFGRRRWAILAWLVMGNLDASGPSLIAASTQIGWINAVKGVVLPAYLWWRLRGEASEVLTTRPAKLWMAALIYASIACLWSPFPLAAAKMVANMFGILLSVIVLERAARKGLVDTRLLVGFVLATLLLGVFQTYYFGGFTYGFDGFDQPARFSSFVGAQQFAALLVALFAAVLFWSTLSSGTRLALLSILVAALVLNGSRTWFFGAGLVLLVYFWFTFDRAPIVAMAFLTLAVFSGVIFARLMTGNESASDEAPSRIAATFTAVLSGQDTARQAGLRTFGFRLAIYDGVAQELRTSSALQLLFGHGTSSGANAALHTFPARYSIDKIDPNRIIHNEWLRGLYEWGVAGFGLLASVFATLVVGLLRFEGGRYRLLSAALLAYLPALIAALSSENILAGAGNAVTLSFGFLCAMLWTSGPSRWSRYRSNRLAA